MTRQDTTKIECPVHLCHTFLTDSGDYNSPTPIIVQDTLVIPLNVIEGGQAVVGYDIPKLRVEKVFAEAASSDCTIEIHWYEHTNIR